MGWQYNTSRAVLTSLMNDYKPGQHGGAPTRLHGGHITTIMSGLALHQVRDQRLQPGFARTSGIDITRHKHIGGGTLAILEIHKPQNFVPLNSVQQQRQHVLVGGQALVRTLNLVDRARAQE